MLQLQQQKQRQKETINDQERNAEEIILEGEGASTIMNPESVSRIISDGNSDTEDSESKHQKNSFMNIIILLFRLNQYYCNLRWCYFGTSCVYVDKKRYCGIQKSSSKRRR